jgi:hypothetical protein
VLNDADYIDWCLQLGLPAPAAWQIEASRGYGKVESKERFPLSHTHDYGDGAYLSPVALH